jgi:hypothetical protein
VAAENFYSAILAEARENEIVLLHGDDDLFCPWGLEHRFQCAPAYDVLLSRSVGRLIFSPTSDRAVYKGTQWPSEGPAHSQPIGLGEISSWGPAFIGSHCYRNTPVFRDAVALAFECCKRQQWLDVATSTLMLPFYLPFCVAVLGGRVGALDSVCVLRGGMLDEVTYAPYGVYGFNSGLCVVLAYGVMSSPPFAGLPEFDSTRDGLAREAAYWSGAVRQDSRIDAKLLSETLKHIRLPRRASFVVEKIKGLRLVLGEVLHLRNWRFRLWGMRGAAPIESWLAKLSGETLKA